MAEPVTSVTTLRVIRMAYLAGVLMFGGVIWFLHRQGFEPMPAEQLGSLRLIGGLVWVAGLIATAYVRGLFGKARVDDQRRTYAIVGWSVAEAVALYGGVFYFMSDDPRWYVAGLFFMLGTFVLYPLRRG